MAATVTFNTHHGAIEVYRDDEHFFDTFASGKHWDDEVIRDNLRHVRDRNVLEVGCHVGTHTVPYARALAPDSVLYGFEPQGRMFELLCRNVAANGLADRTRLHNAAALWYTGAATMHGTFQDGSTPGKSVAEGGRGNYGGLALGVGGERVRCFKLDDLAGSVRDVGFVHSDAQGADGFWLWGAQGIIRRDRPVIFYENHVVHGSYLRDTIVKELAPPKEVVDFDVKAFCMETLGYREYRHGYDSLLVP